MVLVAIAIAISSLRSEVPEAAAAPVAEAPPEPSPAGQIEAIPLPADAVPGGGCIENGIRVTIGAGGCTGCND